MLTRPSSADPHSQHPNGLQTLLQCFLSCCCAFSVVTHSGLCLSCQPAKLLYCGRDRKKVLHEIHTRRSGSSGCSSLTQMGECNRLISRLFSREPFSVPVVRSSSGLWASASVLGDGGNQQSPQHQSPGMLQPFHPTHYLSQRHPLLSHVSFTTSGGRADPAILWLVPLSPQSPVFPPGIHSRLSNWLSLKLGFLCEKASFPTSAGLAITLKSEIHLWLAPLPSAHVSISDCGICMQLEMELLWWPRSWPAWTLSLRVLWQPPAPTLNLHSSLLSCSIGTSCRHLPVSLKISSSMMATKSFLKTTVWYLWGWLCPHSPLAPDLYCTLPMQDQCHVCPLHCTWRGWSSMRHTVQDCN